MSATKYSRHGKFLEEPPWWFRDIVLGILVGTLFLGVQVYYANAQQEISEQLENTRFVRERSSLEHQERPFANLNLEGQNLEGLLLLDADLSGSDLSWANLDRTDLEGSLLAGANLDGARLRGAHLAYATLGQKNNGLSQNILLASKGANLVNADLRHADLNHAKLYGVDFSGSLLEGVNLTGSCFDETTTWPIRFTPPPPSELEDQCGISGIPDDLKPPRNSRYTYFGSATS